MADSTSHAKAINPTVCPTTVQNHTRKLHSSAFHDVVQIFDAVEHSNLARVVLVPRGRSTLVTKSESLASWRASRELAYRRGEHLTPRCQPDSRVDNQIASGFTPKKQLRHTNEAQSS